jgi:predicted SAM-dependent methyltransferase
MATRPISIHARPLRLNLGCSDAHVDGWTNVDLCPPADQIADLSQRWPWDDSSVVNVKAWDIFEHMPDKIHTMNECHRVMEHGGQLDLFIPTTDGRGAFQDPTHKSFWTPNDLFYFCEEFVEWQRFHVAYGITARFRVVNQTHRQYPNSVWKLRAILEAVK